VAAARPSIVVFGEIEAFIVSVADGELTEVAHIEEGLRTLYSP